MMTPLVRIFESVLQMPNLRDDDDFFALGGDSASAIALVLEIERETGVELPDTILFDAPTPAALAEVIAARNTSPLPLVLLKRAGTWDREPPVFIVHGVGGSVMELAVLARRLDTAAPVYGIEAQGLNGKAEPLASIEAMATCYLPAIRAVQPHGPYRLAGYSMGGLVALELAQRLQTAGESVSLLAMLDTQFQPSLIAVLQWPRIWRRRFRDHARRSGSLSLRDVFPFALSRARGMMADLPLILKRNRSRMAPPDPGLPEPLRRVIEAGMTAVRRYRPRRFAGTISFLRADEAGHLPAIPEIVWGDLAAGFTLIPVSGDHWSMLTTDVGDAAARLSLLILATTPEPRQADLFPMPAPELSLCTT